MHTSNNNINRLLILCVGFFFYVHNTWKLHKKKQSIICTNTQIIFKYVTQNKLQHNLRNSITVINTLDLYIAFGA